MPKGNSIRTVVSMALLFLILVLGNLALFKYSDKVHLKELPRAPRFTTNYASSYLGATLTDFERACKGASALLNHDPEKYMICPCDAPRKRFTVHLIRSIELRIVTIVNLEYFSSGVRNFTLLGSEKYPTSEWRVLGSFEAQPAREAQHFDVEPQGSVRFVRFLWATAHTGDAWCTMTTFKVFGVDALETLTEGYAIDMDDPPVPPSAHSAHTPLDPAAQLPALPNAVSSLWGNPSGAASSTTMRPAEESSDTVFTKFFSEEAAPQPWKGHGAWRGCDDGILFNASGTCWPHEREAFERSERCACARRSSFSAPRPKPFQPSTTLLHVMAQMGKQMRALQRSVDESRAWVGQAAWRLEQTEILVRWLLTRMHEVARGMTEHREKIHDVLKELEVMKARLVLDLERRDSGGGGRDPVLWGWMICSSALSFLALSCSLFSKQAPTRRFTMTGSPF